MDIKYIQIYIFIYAENIYNIHKHYLYVFTFKLNIYNTISLGTHRCQEFPN